MRLVIAILITAIVSVWPLLILSPTDNVVATKKSDLNTSVKIPVKSPITQPLKPQCSEPVCFPFDGMIICDCVQSGCKYKDGKCSPG